MNETANNLPCRTAELSLPASIATQHLSVNRYECGHINFVACQPLGINEKNSGTTSTVTSSSTISSGIPTRTKSPKR